MTDTKAAAGDAKIKEETINKVEAGDNETKSPTDGENLSYTFLSNQQNCFYYLLYVGHSE